MTINKETLKSMQETTIPVDTVGAIPTEEGQTISAAQLLQQELTKPTDQSPEPEGPIPGATPASNDTPAPEAKPDDAKPEEIGTFFKKLQSPGSAKPEETPDFEAKYKQAEETIQKQTARLKQYEESPFATLVRLENGEYDLTKLDLKKLGKELAGEDYSNLSFEELVKMDLQDRYSGKLSEEELEKGVLAEVGKIEEWERAAKASQIAERLSAKHTPGEVLKRLESVRNAQAEAQNQPSVEEQIQATIKQISDQFTEYGKELVGQEYQGYKATQEDAEAILKRFQEDANDFNPNRRYMELFRLVTEERRIEAAYQRGLAEGAKEKLNSNAHVAPGGVIVSNSEKKGLANATKQSFRNAKGL